MRAPLSGDIFRPLGLDLLDFGLEVLKIVRRGGELVELVHRAYKAAGEQQKQPRRQAEQSQSPFHVAALLPRRGKIHSS